MIVNNELSVVEIKNYPDFPRYEPSVGVVSSITPHTTMTCVDNVLKLEGQKLPVIDYITIDTISHVYAVDGSLVYAYSGIGVGDEKPVGVIHVVNYKARTNTHTIINGASAIHLVAEPLNLLKPDVIAFYIIDRQVGLAYLSESFTPVLSDFKTRPNSFIYKVNIHKKHIFVYLATFKGFVSYALLLDNNNQPIRLKNGDVIWLKTLSPHK